MGSDAHVIVVGPDAPALAARAHARIDELERLWSRFLEDSEVSRLNRSAGSPLRVSAETRLLVERAKQAWSISAGLYDPTVLGDVLRAGYTRSFDTLAQVPAVEPATSVLRHGAEDIVIAGDTVRLPERTGFDPGGIGKGLAADVVVSELRAAGADGVCVNLGGDVRVSGISPEGGGWTVAVEHAWQAEPVALVGIGEGAVATSTTLLRVWTAPDGHRRHHLIDPHTGLPSDTDVNHATVIASEAWAAEILAKAVLLRGARHAFDILGGSGAEGLIVADDGSVHATEGFGAYLGAATLPARLLPPAAH
jgi:thiamine biosynthesis lipoprotein